MPPLPPEIEVEETPEGVTYRLPRWRTEARSWRRRLPILAVFLGLVLLVIALFAEGLVGLIIPGACLLSLGGLALFTSRFAIKVSREGVVVSDIPAQFSLGTVARQPLRWIAVDVRPGVPGNCGLSSLQAKKWLGISFATVAYTLNLRGYPLPWMAALAADLALRAQTIIDPICPVCRYNLRGVTHPACPECGGDLLSANMYRGGQTAIAPIQLIWDGYLAAQPNGQHQQAEAPVGCALVVEQHQSTGPLVVRCPSIFNGSRLLRWLADRFLLILLGTMVFVPMMVFLVVAGGLQWAALGRLCRAMAFDFWRAVGPVIGVIVLLGPVAAGVWTAYRWLVKGSARSITADHGQLRIQHSVWGLGYRRRWPRDELIALGPLRNMGGESICLTLRRGRRRRIPLLPGYRYEDAAYAAALIRRTMNLPSCPPEIDQLLKFERPVPAASPASLAELPAGGTKQD